MEGRPRSSVELSLELSEPLSSIAYHLRVLQLCGAAKRTASSPSIKSGVACHQSVVSGDRLVADQLAATEAQDEAVLRRPVDKRPRRAISSLARAGR